MADHAPPERIDHARGDATGLTIPAHAAAFEADGSEFLTRAFHAFGSLPEDNTVARIVAIEPCGGGSTGDKLFVTIEYARPDPALRTELFVKLSRDFTDSRRDVQRWEMAGEARFAAISRLPGFPIEVPEAMFADFESATGTGLVVTERIRFGEDGIEPHRRKCMDHLTLDDPMPHYRAIVTALARLAGAHKGGRLAPDIDTRFPWDPEHAGLDPIRYDEAKLDAVLGRAIAFAQDCPQLLPEAVRTPAFLARMREQAPRIREHQAAIRAYLLGDPDFAALCHWNAHIDNAWFRRDAAGDLHCGLIDWGRVGQISIGSILWGALSAAHHRVWENLDELLALFADEYHAHGGPQIAVQELELHLVLHVAAMGVARVLAFPEVVLFRLPAAATASGPEDPVFWPVDPARNCLHIYTVFLNLWATRDFGAKLDILLERSGA